MGTGGVFSKLRAGLLPVETTVLAASLLRCAAALSFLAPGTAVGVLVWGARDVIGDTRKRKRVNLQYVQLAETDSAKSLAPGPILVNQQKAT